jgi:hypothetical protein
MAVLLAAVVPAGRTSILAQSAGDAQVRAAFVFNFTKFVTWPGETSGALVIGVAGDADLAGSIAGMVSGRRRAVTVRVVALVGRPLNAVLATVHAMLSSAATQFRSREESDDEACQSQAGREPPDVSAQGRRWRRRRDRKSVV